MKKLAILALLLLPALFLLSQVEKHEVTVTNVGVLTRVLDGNRFVDDLKIDDFEIYEDGKPQKIEALYLVKKTRLDRKEASREFYPALFRHFYLIFQITEYNPKLDEAIDYLINSVLLPDDSLAIWTPAQKYNLTSEALKKLPKETISKEMKSILRKDTKIGASYYNDLLKDLKRLVRSMSSSTGFRDQSNVMSDIESESATTEALSMELLLPRYRATLQKLEELRVADEKNFIQFAEALKKQEGENHVYFFYQREFRPEISPTVLNHMISIYQENPNVMGELQDLFVFHHREIEFNRLRIKQSFADSSVIFNFIFMNKEPEYVSGLNMREQSEDIFSVFSEVAKATGGIVNSSQNPAHGFKTALESTEAHYLLYYSPTDYQKDGKFKSIEVKLKEKGYKVFHRLGYFAN